MKADYFNEATVLTNSNGSILRLNMGIYHGTLSVEYVQHNI